MSEIANWMMQVQIQGGKTINLSGQEKADGFDSFGGDDIGAGVVLLVFFYLISPWLWPALLTALLAYFSFRTLRKVIQWIKHRKDGKITPETA